MGNADGALYECLSSYMKFFVKASERVYDFLLEVRHVWKKFAIHLFDWRMEIRSLETLQI